MSRELQPGEYAALEANYQSQLEAKDKELGDCGTQIADLAWEWAGLSKRLERAEAVCELAKLFVGQVAICHNDPRYESVWATAQRFCGPYQGPKYEVEMVMLSAALQAWREGFAEVEGA
jgi:hypothetical protein